ncbi:hypothetical protein [Burkholderia vietnamiensis]|uniref:hypothetical protein n=1 Tax=Burkholderia vietnamiensis TaxID=60552 RepID=UPI0015897D67|nr:hypothetical protein [Burkholderia vietnamiensis]
MQRRTKTAAEYDSTIAKGNEAAALLSNPMLGDILEKMEREATQKLLDSLKQEEREVAWHKVTAVRDVRRELQSIANSGKLAASNKKQLGGE